MHLSEDKYLPSRLLMLENFLLASQFTSTGDNRRDKQAGDKYWIED